MDHLITKKQVQEPDSSEDFSILEHKDKEAMATAFGANDNKPSTVEIRHEREQYGEVYEGKSSSKRHLTDNPSEEEAPQINETIENKVSGSITRRNEEVHETVPTLFKCEICDATFTSKQYLKRHGQVHVSEKSYECDICLKRFRHQQNLSRHFRYHTEGKQYECSICNRRFTQKGNLKRHEIVHTGEKPYQCEICLKRFGHLGSLNDHKRLHTGEKPYECDICEKTFSRKDKLQGHKRVHIGGDGGEPATM